jgi:hypothetical protein
MKSSRVFTRFPVGQGFTIKQIEPLIRTIYFFVARTGIKNNHATEQKKFIHTAYFNKNSLLISRKLLMSRLIIKD